MGVAIISRMINGIASLQVSVFSSSGYCALKVGVCFSGTSYGVRGARAGKRGASLSAGGVSLTPAAQGVASIYLTEPKDKGKDNYRLLKKIIEKKRD
jgi:hypothetical protein